ncbi:MAG: bifunctional DNA primase/polymerase [Rhodospirillales bacterium]|nr:bifunctional DNA primase/polymerase [Acetobacter sp.]
MVLLAVAKNRKNPILNAWQKVRRDSMDDPEYLASLNHGGNIGVLLGTASGGVCAIDFDADADADAFLASNPGLVSSFRTRGARGCQVWILAQGAFPPSGDAKNASGSKVAEWRADGRQSVVWGIHPDGHEYRWLVDAPPLLYHFEQILWPQGWRGPWMPEPTQASELRTDKHLASSGVIILPSGDVSILDCANTVFPMLARTRRVFTRGGTAVELVNNVSGPSKGLSLEQILPAGFRSRLENCGSLVVWRKGKNGQDVLQPTTCPEDMARALLASQPARELLPPIAAVTGCPIAIENGEGNLEILARGYHPQLGGLLVTVGVTPPRVDVQEAVKALSDLLTEFETSRRRQIARARWRRLFLLRCPSVDSFEDEFLLTWLRLTNPKPAKGIARRCWQPFTTKARG